MEHLPSMVSALSYTTRIAGQEKEKSVLCLTNGGMRRRFSRGCTPLSPGLLELFPPPFPSLDPLRSSYFFCDFPGLALASFTTNVEVPQIFCCSLSPQQASCTPHDSDVCRCPFSWYRPGFCHHPVATTATSSLQLPSSTPNPIASLSFVSEHYSGYFPLSYLSLVGSGLCFRPPQELTWTLATLHPSAGAAAHQNTCLPAHRSLTLIPEAPHPLHHFEPSLLDS